MRLRLAALALLAACSGGEPAAEQSSPPAKAAADSAVPKSAAAAPAPERDAALDSAFAAAEAESGGTLGVAAIHLPSGRRIGQNADQAFPMASTFKLAVAMAVLAKVDSGSMSLDQPVTVTPADYWPGGNDVADDLPAGGGALPARRLVEAMMVYSDNTATDALMRVIGGPRVVTAHLRARGIEGIRVDRPEGQIYLDYNGVRQPPPPGGWTREERQRARDAVPADERGAAQARFRADPRDTATPDGFAALLVQLQRGEGISPASRAFLLDAMRRSPTGTRRIRAGVPRGTEVADKTGTIGRTTNDVGIVTLPDGSHVALAVFVRDSPRGNEQVEPAIASAARIVYGRFAGPR